MNIAVKGIAVRENRALEDYAFKKASKFYHYYPEITKIEVELRTEDGRAAKDDDFIADMTLHIPGKTLKVSDQERDLYKAVDRASRRMIESLRREKSKHQSLLRRQVRKFFNRGTSFVPEVWASVNKRVFRRER